MSKTRAVLLGVGAGIAVLFVGLTAAEPAAAWYRETFYAEALRRDGVPMNNHSAARRYMIASEFEEAGRDHQGTYTKLNWADERIVEGYTMNAARAQAMLLHVFPDVLNASDFNPANGRLQKAGASKALRAMCRFDGRAHPFAIPGGIAILGAVIAQQSGIPIEADGEQDLSCGGLLMADARQAQAAADRCYQLNEAAADEAAARGDMDAVNRGIASRC